MLSRESAVHLCRSLRVGILQMGQLLFTDSKAWNDDYMGPAMMAPPLFCMLVLASGFAWLVMYCCFDWWHRRHISYQTIPQAIKADKEEAPQDGRQFESFSIDDSANETSDGEALLLSLFISVHQKACTAYTSPLW